MADDIKETDKNQKFISEVGEKLLKVTEPILKLLKKYKARILIIVLTIIALNRNQESAIKFIKQFQGLLSGGGDLTSMIPAMLGGSPKLGQKRRRTLTLKKGSRYRRRR